MECTRWSVLGGVYSVESTRWSLHSTRWSLLGGVCTVESARWSLHGGVYTVESARWSRVYTLDSTPSMFSPFNIFPS